MVCCALPACAMRLRAGTSNVNGDCQAKAKPGGDGSKAKSRGRSVLAAGQCVELSTGWGPNSNRELEAPLSQRTAGCIRRVSGSE